MPRPLLTLAIAFGTGCFLGGASGRVGGLALAALASALLVLALTAPNRRAIGVALLAATLGLGAADAAFERLAYEAAPLLAFADARDLVAGPVALQGIARGDLAVFPDRAQLVLDVERIDEAGQERVVTGRIRIDIGGRARGPAILDGDGVRLWATVGPITAFRTPGAFDAREAAFHDGVHARGACKSQRLVEVQRRGTGLQAVAGRLRQHARAVFARFIPAGPEEGLVRAMVLGDRTGIDDATADAFRAAGTYHVLALSGAQVALVAALLVASLRWLGAGPATQALVAVSAITFYALLVGGDVPVVRAAVMAAAVLLGRALELDGDVSNLLGLAALVLLAHRPSNVADVGFQLSFVATLGIVLLTPPLVAGWPRLPVRAELAVAGSLAAQVSLLPFLAAHFHRMAPASLVLNLLAVPLSSAVLVAGLGLWLGASVVPPVAPLLGDLAWLLAHALRRSSDLAALAPALDWRVPALSFVALAAWASGLAWIRKGRRAAGLVLVLLAQVAPALEPDSPGDGRLHLTVLDVGQGDALVVRSPGGHSFVVDAGGSPRGRFDLGERVVGPFLWATGVRRVDTVVVTHAHPDHAGGAPFLLRAFGVREIWEGPAAPTDAAYRILDEAIHRSRVGRRTVVRGVVADWDGVSVEVLGPPSPRRPPRSVRNDDSVVLALRFGDVRFLLTGDIESAGEAELLRSGRAALAAAVLKAPHHGSRSSSSVEFVAAVGPIVAVVSAGDRNPFGHPHPDVVRRYREAGALVLRTDRDGTTFVSTDGQRLWIRNPGQETARRVR
jgi:competence protein ComEC